MRKSFNSLKFWSIFWTICLSVPLLFQTAKARPYDPHGLQLGGSTAIPKSSFRAYLSEELVSCDDIPGYKVDALARFVQDKNIHGFKCSDPLIVRNYLKASKEMREHAFLQYATEEQVKENVCEVNYLNMFLDDTDQSESQGNTASLDQIKKVYPNLKDQKVEGSAPRDSSAAKLREQIIGDIADKIPQLRALKKDMEEKEIEFEKVRIVIERHPGIAKTERYIKGSTAFNLAKKRYGALMSSIWNSSSPEMQAYLDDAMEIQRFNRERFIKNAMTPNKKYSLERRVIKPLRTAASERLQDFAEMGTDFDEDYRTGLQETGLAKKYMYDMAESTKTDFSEMACQYDARYGKGRDRLFWTAQAALAVATLGSSSLIQSLGVAARIGATTIRAAQILSVGTLDVMNTYVSDCLGGEGPSELKANICEQTSKPGSQQKIDLLGKEIDQGNCALGLTLAALGTVGGELVSKYSALKAVKGDNGPTGSPGVETPSATRAPTESLSIGEPASPEVIAALASQKPNWADFTRMDQLQLKRYAETLNDHYVSSIGKTDPQKAYLESLGFKFGDDFQVPQPSNILNRVDAKVDDLVTRGVLKESEVLRPVRVFQDQNGKMIFLKAGDEIPEGAKSFNGIIKGKEYHQMIADGHYPVGDPNVIVDGQFGGSSMFLHDVGHFGTFEEHPQLMAQFRDVARTMLKEKYPKGQKGRAIRRLMYIQESMVVPKPNAPSVVNDIAQRKGVDLRMGEGAVKSAEEYSEALKKLSDEELAQLFFEFKKQRNSFISSSSGGSRTGHVYDEMMDSGEIVGNVDSIGIEVFEGAGFLLNPKDEMAREILRNNILKSGGYYLRAIDGQSRLTIDDYFEGLASPTGPPRDSKVYDLFCKKRIINDSEVRDAFCN